MTIARDLSKILDANGDFNIDANTLFVDSSTNRVGIGTGSPSTHLHVTGSSTAQLRGQNGAEYFELLCDSTNSIFSSTGPIFLRTNNADPIIFQYSTSSEAMRIDSSGNVLVGNTSNTTSQAGVYLNSNGRFFATNSGSSSIFNRLSSDGDILLFQKDTTTVGSIGTVGGDLMFGTGDTHLRMTDGVDSIIPVTNTGADRDNAMDLGYSTVRFRNAYLGGNIYLGGTGSANALDDYEEGTWTPRFNRDVNLASVAYSRQTGVYTKIGHTVIAWFDLIVTSYSGGGGDYILHGLPFTSNLGSTNGGYSIPVIRAATLMPTDFKIYGNSSYHNTNTDYFYFRHYNSSGTEVASSPNGSGRVSGFTIYTTSS